MNKETAASQPCIGTTLASCRLREEFPILRQRVHGKPLVYLDNAASTHKPRAVIDAVSNFYSSENSNVHRGLHELSARATADYERARDSVQRMIGARDRREIVFTRGTTEAINLVAYSFGNSRLGAGDEVLITAMEHHSNIVPWQLLCKRRGAKLRVAPIDDAGDVILDEFEALLGPRTKLAAFVHVSNALGTVNPVKKMTAMAHANGTTVLIDGAQAVAHRPVDVLDLGCDFYAFSGHKMYGPTGIGVLYGRAELLESMPPFQAGGEMIRSVTFDKTTFNDLPYKFEAGTPDIAGTIGLGAAVSWFEALDQIRVEAAERELLDYAVERLFEIPGVHPVGSPKHRSGAVSFRIDGIHPHDVATILDHEGVAVRAGHHCAQPVMERFGVPATVRASFACYNVREEVDALVAGVGRVIDILGRLMSELRELYQEVVLDHGKKPRNFRALPDADGHAEGYNPLCGDRLTVYVRRDGDRIDEVTFEGAGCAISTASASMMTQALRGKSQEEVEALFRAFHDLVTEAGGADPDEEVLGKLVVFTGVREFPVRVKCATLAWHTLRAAIENREEPATTE